MFYEQIKHIGFGANSVVEEVKHKLIGENRAMKIIKKDNPVAKSEISILRTISHPNIMQVYEILEDEKNFYIITEYLKGLDLFEHLKVSKTFNESRAKTVVHQILRALAFLHSINILHRDIKPENVCFKYQGQQTEVKLIDFGSAAKLDYYSQICTEFNGTSYYIAPEVFRHSYNEKCDIWSTGVIFFIILCGYPPFNGKSRTEIYEKICNNHVKFVKEDWQHVNENAIDLIKQMLRKNPDSRISAKEALAHKYFEDITEMNKVREKTITAFERFITEDRLKKLFLFYISSQVDLESVKSKISKEFRKFDQNQDGLIKLDFFVKTLDKLESKKAVNF